MGYDLLVEDCIIVELKAVLQMIPIFEAQAMSYAKILQVPKAVLINFTCTNIFKEGQKTCVMYQKSSFNPTIKVRGAGTVPQSIPTAKSEESPKPRVSFAFAWISGSKPGYFVHVKAF